MKPHNTDSNMLLSVTRENFLVKSNDSKIPYEFKIKIQEVDCVIHSLKLQPIVKQTSREKYDYLDCETLAPAIEKRDVLFFKFSFLRAQPKPLML